MLPDQYTKTLVGGVVDQSVFEQLVQDHLPNLYERMKNLGISLSTFSVPWFLSLFINNVKLHTAIKFLDVFFLEGSKFLFWISISILKILEKQLLKLKQDDTFILLIKDYLINLEDGQEYPNLMKEACFVVAPYITNQTIESLRIRFKLSVVNKMEIQNKKSQVRLLSEQVLLSQAEIGIIYDQFSRLQFLKIDQYQTQSQIIDKLKQKESEIYHNLFVAGGFGNKHQRKQKNNAGDILLSDFQNLLYKLLPFKKCDRPEDLYLSIIDRIYFYIMFQNSKKAIDLATIVHTLDVLMKQPLPLRLRFIFNLYDVDGDGFLSKSELKSIMDAFLDIFTGAKYVNEEVFLKATSNFLQAALNMGSSGDTFSLNFNEFLLALLSQTCFVEYYERIWTLVSDNGRIDIQWQKGKHT
jgi:Ca2+-binding EF-hand superfamily protein